jgi:IgGFc binding protein
MRVWALLACFAIACGPGGRRDGNGNGSNGSGAPTCPACSPDGTGVVDCQGTTTECPNGMACSSGACLSACDAAAQNHLSVGCEYYAVDMDAAQGPPSDACYTVFVANTSRDPVHINASWNGQSIDLAQFAKLPTGTGQSLTYQPYDPTAGLAAGKVAILFLAYSFQLGNVACPVPAAIGHGPQLSGTGIGHAFHITTDMPVVAYQMLPYGGGNAAATGASLLLPTSAWGTNYVAVSAYDTAAPPIPIPMGPSHDYVALEDNTLVTIRPKSAIAAGGGLPAGTANTPYSVTIPHAGDYFQITQADPLSGSPVSSDKPIGGFGGHQIMSIDRCCGDHGEQMLAPVRALASEYVAAPHGDRKPPPDPRVFRVYGAVDGTQLVYDPPTISGPATLNLGDMAEIRTDGAFTIKSQDADHPFSIFTYMTGAGDQGQGGWGDPDFVRLPPPAQYLSHYVFFTDATYPFTMLTVVRQKQMGAFADVMIECGGVLSGWQPVGTSGDYEIAFLKLVDHWNGQNGCNNGVHVMDSTVPFGVWVWGWGSEDTNTGWVSYGFPAGEGVVPINDVVIE